MSSRPEFHHTLEGEDFKDISSEEYREYVFPRGVVRINKPLKLHVSKSGGHRVYDGDGVSHYIPYKWIHIHWKGSPNFAF